MEILCMHFNINMDPSKNLEKQDFISPISAEKFVYTYYK